MVVGRRELEEVGVLGKQDEPLIAREGEVGLVAVAEPVHLRDPDDVDASATEPADDGLGDMLVDVEPDDAHGRGVRSICRDAPARVAWVPSFCFRGEGVSDRARSAYASPSATRRSTSCLWS